MRFSTRRGALGAGASAAVLLGCAAVPGVAAAGDALSCKMDGYVAAGPVRVAAAPMALNLTWKGEANQDLAMRLGVTAGKPIIESLTINGQTIAENASLEYRLVTGYRRMSNQQMVPLRELGVEITHEEIEDHKWDVFWDAPLDLRTPPARPGGGEDGPGGGGNPPPVAGVATQPGLPRKPDEITRAVANYAADGCTVTTEGARVSVAFPKMTAASFAGELVITVFQGTNLIKTEFVASTQATSMAYKYDVGLTGLTLTPDARVLWRDTSNVDQAYGLKGPANAGPVPIRAANRLVVAQTGAGSVAAFTPPHTYFWAREVEINVGNNWYRKDSDRTFTIGIRQGEDEVVEQYRANWSLYSAPPGTVQRMAAFFYPTLGAPEAAFRSTLAFTNSDKYRPLPGYKIMGAHYHTNMGERLLAAGNPDLRLPDFEVLRAAGLDIAAPTDRPRDQPNQNRTRLQVMQSYFQGAQKHSDDKFLVMPNFENGQYLGGHWDVLVSKPTYWTEGVAGQPFKRTDPVMGTVYNVNNAQETMRMIEEQNMLVFMPHPRTKGSTHFPDAVRNDGPFDSNNYRGVGWRWGMGSDLSETRLSEKRVLPLMDEMANWMTAKGLRPKGIMAITETYAKAPGDDIYANGPVSYLKLATLPTRGDYAPIIDVMNRGDYFVTSGEVLVPSHALTGAGRTAVLNADVEWTFPLDMVEVVWGDGAQTHRKVVSAKDLQPFGKRSFSIPFDATGAKWFRFAAWDTAGNGAMTQPTQITAR
jgi:hypothetical protein